MTSTDAIFIALIETHLIAYVADVEIWTPNHLLSHANRKNRINGELAMYIRDVTPAILCHTPTQCVYTDKAY